jgi:hypothetical protein
MEIRKYNKATLDNDLWASADHFFNAWNAQDYFNDNWGPTPFNGILGDLAGTAWNNIYSACKAIPYIRDQFLPRDNPDIPPTDVTWQQRYWGARGGDASFWFPTNMRPGGPTWRLFVAWIEDVEDEF